MPLLYKIETLAYTKLILHAAKHPHAPVNGVLLGTFADKQVVVTDTIPLLHHWTSLSPMMEIGLDLARSHAAERQLKVVGYYQATDRPEERVLFPVGEKVASVIRENFDDAFAVVIDGTVLGGEESALIPYLTLSSTSSWEKLSPIPILPSPSSQFTLEDSSAPRKALKAVREQELHLQFGDFDDHLEDVTIDWLRNSGVTFLLSG